LITQILLLLYPLNSKKRERGKGKGERGKGKGERGKGKEEKGKRKGERGKGKRRITSKKLYLSFSEFIWLSNVVNPLHRVVEQIDDFGNVRSIQKKKSLCYELIDCNYLTPMTCWIELLKSLIPMRVSLSILAFFFYIQNFIDFFSRNSFDTAGNLYGIVTSNLKDVGSIRCVVS
jgi:hypothetical protein